MSDYKIRTWYSYNAFGADEHYCVGLYRFNHKIGTWAYSTFFSSKIAHHRAEARIVHVRLTYEADLE